MKRASITLLTFVLFYIGYSPLPAQPFKRICVIGSSTAWGYFRDPNPPYDPVYPRDSAWTFKLSKYYKDLGMIDTLYNIASIGTDPYTGMPTSYVPPAQRNVPDNRYNITKAINLVPKPDVIIVNYPTNNFDWQSEQEILFCLQTIKDSANANGIQCYITTTQPRNTFSASERQKLKDLRNIILNRFGQYAIDFFSDIVQEPSLGILPVYSLGDGIHTNPKGQTVLEQKVIEKNILLNTLPVDFIDFKAFRQNNSINLSWGLSIDYDFSYFIVERSSNGRDFFEIASQATMQSTGAQKFSFIDEHPLLDINYFRIVAIQKNSRRIFSKVTPVMFSNSAFSVGKIFPVPSKSEINIKVFAGEKGTLTFSIINEEGKLVKKETRATQNVMLYKANVSKLTHGKYTLVIQSNAQQEGITFVK